MQDTLLNLIPGACSPEVHLSQYDKGRVVPFKLADGKSAYDVPAGSAIVVKATKPSGLGFVVPVSFEGDTATMTITETMSNEYGRFPAELSITNGGTLIGTANFVMNIERSPHPEGTIDGDAETIIPELTLLVTEIRESVETATELVERAEESAESVTELEPRVTAVEGNISNINTELSVLDARMDTFASLPDGSTSGDAELTDIRVAYDGIVYPSAGDSVRGQISEIADDVFDISYIDGDAQVFAQAYDNCVIGHDGWAITYQGWKISNAIAVPNGAKFIKANYSTDFGSNNGYAVMFATVSSMGNPLSVIKDITSGIYIPIPNGATYVRFSYQDASIDSFCFATMNKESIIAPLEDGLSQISNKEEYTEAEETVIVPTWSVGFVDGGNGRTYTGGSYDNFRYSQKIAVAKDDIISLNAIADGSAKEMRCVVAYSGDTFDSSASKPQGVNSYTVPDGIDGIIITTRVAYENSEIHRVENIIKTAYHIVTDKMGYMTVKGNLSDGETLKLLENNSKNSNVLVFTCRVSNFNSIKIGKNTSGTPNIVIDNTNITINNGGNNAPIPHGLTIADDLQVTIETTPHNNRLKKVTVSSRGIDYVITTDYGWLDDQGEPFVTSIGSTLTGCVLSWTSRDINKPIWVFGDSYVTYHNTRWPYYLAENGYDESSMINGYSGEASAQAYIGLNNLLTLRVPKMVVWCLGMNNGDSDSAVNSSWKEYYEKAITLSKKYGFELILCTIPTTPTVNNDFKNAIIRASGYRCVDIDSAVRLPNSRNWISGLLSSDDTHPTVQGGKVIYRRFLADLPEFTSK